MPVAYIVGGNAPDSVIFNLGGTAFPKFPEPCLERGFCVSGGRHVNSLPLRRHIDLRDRHCGVRFPQHSLPGLAMDDMTAAEQAMLFEFGRDVFNAAVLAGYVAPPWKPSRDAYVAMHELFLFRFSPAQAAEAMFAVRH
jgi:hypothetical protein